MHAYIHVYCYPSIHVHNIYTLHLVCIPASPITSYVRLNSPKIIIYVYNVYNK